MEHVYLGRGETPEKWEVGKTYHFTAEFCPHAWGFCGSSFDELHACGRGAGHDGPCRCRSCHSKAEPPPPGEEDK